MGTVPAFASLGEAMDMARDALSCLAAADAIQLATKTQAECLWGLAAGQSSESAARTICLWTERLPEKSQEESDELLVTAAANRAARAVAAATGGRAVKITQAYRFALWLRDGSLLKLTNPQR